MKKKYKLNSPLKIIVIDDCKTCPYQKQGIDPKKGLLYYCSNKPEYPLLKHKKGIPKSCQLFNFTIEIGNILHNQSLDLT